MRSGSRSALDFADAGDFGDLVDLDHAGLDLDGALAPVGDVVDEVSVHDFRVAGHVAAEDGQIHVEAAGVEVAAAGDDLVAVDEPQRFIAIVQRHTDGFIGGGEAGLGDEDAFMGRVELKAEMRDMLLGGTQGCAGAFGGGRAVFSAAGGGEALFGDMQVGAGGGGGVLVFVEAVGGIGDAGRVVQGGGRVEI